MNEGLREPRTPRDFAKPGLILDVSKQADYSWQEQTGSRPGLGDRPTPNGTVTQNPSDNDDD